MVKKLETVTTHTFVLSEEETFTIIDALHEYGDDALADELSGLIEEGCACDSIGGDEYPLIGSVDAFDKLMRDLLIGDDK